MSKRDGRNGLARFRSLLTGARIFLWLLPAISLGCLPKAPPVAPPGYPAPYKVGGEWYQPIPNAKDFRQLGIASWYGEDFHGRKTSSGEIYNMHAMTAAHKTLPLGTFVRVRHQGTGREIVVKVNDRGPFVSGRIIDLSYAAAKELGIVDIGTAPVQVVALGRAAGGSGSDSPAYIPGDYYSGNFTFQVAAFKELANAERLKTKLGKTYPNAHIFKWDNGKDVFYRVRVGRYSNLEQIAADETILARDGYPDAFIVAE
ncbi:MAG: septal ring lytic transglycosylase RlpA family protein [Thermodesulfobacteriota bacterium]